MATSYADHVTPREAVRGALRDHLRELVDASVQRIDVDAPLDPEAPGELDANGQPAKLWQNVPVVTVRDLETALATVSGAEIAAPSATTAEVATPATVFVAAECPRCHIAGRIPLVVTVELHQDNDGETLHLKPKSKEALHTWSQLPLPQGEDEAEQLPWDVEGIIGPAPSVQEIEAAIGFLTNEELDRAGYPEEEEAAVANWPTEQDIDGWPDATKREVLAWAQALHQSSENETTVPPLPVVLGGTAPEPAAEPTIEETAAPDEAADEADGTDCPFAGCILPSYHDGLHDVPGPENDLLP
jgi:hypothetical protein